MSVCGCKKVKKNSLVCFSVQDVEEISRIKRSCVKRKQSLVQDVQLKRNKHREGKRSGMFLPCSQCVFYMLIVSLLLVNKCFIAWKCLNRLPSFILVVQEKRLDVDEMHFNLIEERRTIKGWKPDFLVNWFTTGGTRPSCRGTCRNVIQNKFS